MSQFFPVMGKESGKLQLQSLCQWNVVMSSTSVMFQSGFWALAQFPLAASPHYYRSTRAYVNHAE